jgi:hypothetical protein
VPFELLAPTRPVQSHFWRLRLAAMGMAAIPNGMTDHTPEPFLYRDGDQFVPTRQACGFWGPPDNFHARVVIGLFAREIERAHGAPDLQPTRLTVDLYRMPDLSAVTVDVRPIREGRRIKVIEAELFQNGKSHARAACQFLMRTEQPANPIWSPPPWSVPAPEDVPPPDEPFTTKWEMRPILPAGVQLAGSLRSAGQRRTWLREVRPLIGGEAHTPFSRIATGVDYTSPTAHSAVEGLDFINSDVTLYLAREPVGEWIGYEVANHQSFEGVAVGGCSLYDTRGPVGFSSCAALVQKRQPQAGYMTR